MAESPRLRLLMRALPALLLVVQLGLLVLTSLGKKLSYDEPYHLWYGHRFLTQGPDVQARERLPAVVLSSLPCLATGCRPEDLDAGEGRRLLMRAPSMAFALLLGLVLYRWTGEALGARAARLTLALYALNPTVLAHGKQVTGDMPASFFTAAALYAAWRFARRPGLGPFALATAATAGAALSKYSSLYLLALVPALAGSSLQAWRERAGAGARLWRGLAAGAGFLLAVLLLINVTYRFHGTLTPAGRLEWRSDPFRGAARLGLPLPVPVAYAQGLDFAAALDERRGGFGFNYLLGRRSPDGVWYAFPVMLLLKTPLAFFGLLGLALRHLVRRGERPVWRFWLVPALAHLALFSSFVQAQLGVRYVMPSLVLLMPVAGAAAQVAHRPWPALRALLVAWYALSSLSYLPHPMCYFNELIGPRLHAYRFLADSNLDWEDRDAEIARYLARHAERRIALEPERPQAGYVLVGVNRLLGLVGDDRFRWLRARGFEPVDHVGYSYLLFFVTEQGGAAPHPLGRPLAPAE